MPEIDVYSKKSIRWLSSVISNYKDFFTRCLFDEGYQVFSIKYDSLIGVMEGPPNTSYENGYFLFKIIFPDNYPLEQPTFIFMTKIFHPNISENGLVSIDSLGKEWTPAIRHFHDIIYSVMSLLDDPNPEIFFNEIAAKLYKENRDEYEETVKEYISLYSNYSLFQNDLKNLNLKFKEIKINDNE